jgi:hypothetical protein
MKVDLNNAQPELELIPSGIYKLKITVRAHNSVVGDILRTAKNGILKMLDLELTVVDGEHDKRKLWQLIAVDFDPDAIDPADPKIANYKKAVSIGLTKLRSIVESARNIDRKDNSDMARTKRHLDDLTELNGMVFQAYVGVEEGTNGNRDRNCLSRIIMPGTFEYDPPTQATNGASRAVVRAPQLPPSDDMSDEIPF